MIDWKLDPIFSSYTGILLLSAVLVSGFLTFSERSSLNLKQRFLLGSLRWAIVILLIVAMLRPGLTFVQQKAPRGVVAVLVDQSTSMELASGSGSRSRWEIEKEVWHRLRAYQPALGNSVDLVLYTYDDKLHLQVGEKRESIDLPAAPTGMLTDVGRTLAQLLEQQSDPPVLGVIWMGDASQTVTPPKVDAPSIARQLGMLDVPLMLIGVGPRSDTELVKDVAIETVPEQFVAFSQNQIQVKGTIRARGAANRGLTVQLFLVQGGKEQELGRDRVQPDQNDQTLPFRISMIAPAEGAYELKVRVQPIDGEMVAENNEMISFLNVHGGGRRVLYLEGNPYHLEQKYINLALNESKELQVSFRAIGEGSADDRRKTWPISLKTELESREFDAIVLGDLDADALGNDNLKRLVDCVEAGAGLITLGGFHAYGPGGYANTPLDKILPVRIGGASRQRFGAPIVSNHFDRPLALVPVRVNHPIMRLESEERTAENWRKLAPLLGANRWEGQKTGTGIQVLAEGPERQPLIVSGEAGKGRVLCLAFDSTYQWWLQGHQNLHKTFWRQALLWALREEVATDKLELEMAERRLFKHQSSTVVVRLKSSAAEAKISPSTRLRLYQGDQDISPVNLTARDNSSLIGTIQAPSTSGRYELRAETLTANGEKLESKFPFIVLEQSIESLQPIPDWQTIHQMARLNEAAGGGIFAPEQVDELMNKLIDRRKTATVQIIESYRLGDGAADSWLIFLAMAGLLIGQWSLRKRWNLA